MRKTKAKPISNIEVGDNTKPTTQPLPEHDGRRQRATKDELRERVEFTEWLLSRRLPKSQIKKLLKTKYGVGARQMENYLSRARKRILARTGRSKDRHFMDALAFYESVLTGTTSTEREKMLAQDRICDLLGLRAPTELIHKGDKDAPLLPDMAKIGQAVEDALKYRRERFPDGIVSPVTAKGGEPAAAATGGGDDAK